MPGYQTFHLHEVIPRNFQEVLHYVAGPTSLALPGESTESKTDKRSVDPEMLSVELDKKEDKDGQGANKEKLVDPLVRLKVEGRDGHGAEKEEIVEPLVRLVRYDSSKPNALDSILPRRARGQATRSKITQEGKARSGETFLPIQVRRSKFLLPPLGGLANKHVKRITLFAPQDFVFQ